jgi:hypothetical protein
MRMVMMAAVVMKEHRLTEGSGGLVPSQMLKSRAEQQIFDPIHSDFECWLRVESVDRIPFSLYYHPIMQACCQNMTVCCCTCCHTFVRSGNGRLLT